MGTYGDSEQNVDNWFDYLKKIFPKFKEELVEKKWVFRFNKAQHVVDTRYKIPKSKIENNIYITNFAQIFPEDRGTNFAVREGMRVADLM